MKFTCITIYGSLLNEETLAKLGSTESSVKGQKSSDFKIETTILEHVSGVWGEAKDLFSRYTKRKERLSKLSKPSESSLTTTKEYWIKPLFDLLDFRLTDLKSSLTLESKEYRFTNRDGVILHIIPHDRELSKKEGPRSPHGTLQEYLNLSEEIYGMVTNGSVLRLLRNSTQFTRETYLEVDLESLFIEEKFDEFLIFFRLFHRSRFPKEGESLCLLEEYYTETLEEGGRIRERLRVQVERAIERFANGFLRHPENEFLRNGLNTGKISANLYYGEILYLVYRLLFVLVAEERRLLGSTENPFLEAYGLKRLREEVGRGNFSDPHDDSYRQIKVLFHIFQSPKEAERLGFPAPGGELFKKRPLIDVCELKNTDFHAILKSLLYYTEGGSLKKINYSALNVEELGSVYESLLDFSPSYREGEFSLLLGTERKSTGSHYTHTDLVAEALRRSLQEKIAELHESTKKLGEAEKLERFLSLKVLDPSCGSGHFLLASARILGKEIARLKFKTGEPDRDELKEGIRLSISHNIFGVDKNPLAVDLCKTALWMEGMSQGKPLSFLDSKIRTGDSLLGLYDINCITQESGEFGIPDSAYTTGGLDDKKIAGLLKKENIAERKNQIQSTLFPSAGGETSVIRKTSEELEEIPEETAEDIQKKEERFRTLRKVGGVWWKEKLAADLYLSAFFLPLSPENKEKNLLITTESLRKFLKNPEDLFLSPLVRQAEELSEKLRFFHWKLEFPFLLERGFDVVVGNPPWERIKIQEIEFFSTRDKDVSEAANKAEREKKISILKKANSPLYDEFREEKHRSEASGKFFRGGGRFPLTSGGDINTYSLFAELFYTLLDKKGKSSVILPTGIATDDTNKEFFGMLVEKGVLRSLLDFENRKKIFPDVDSRQKFCILSLDKNGAKETRTAFFLLETSSLSDRERVFVLSPKDFSLFNPNTRTTPIFRTRKDVEITRKIYERFPILINETTGENPWGVRFKTIFHMSNDSHLFLNSPAENTLPLYEGKLFHHFDHRFATYENGSTRDTTEEEKRDPHFRITPRYWVRESDVESALVSKDGSKIWDRKWFLGWRDIARSTDERTMISSILPWAGVGHNAPICISKYFNKVYLLYINIVSLVYDFVTRLKTGGTHLNFFIFQQIPVIPPPFYTREDRAFLLPLALQLIFTDYSLLPFVEDLREEASELGISLPTVPYVFREEERHKLRSRIDAYYARLYGLSREELLYILDPAALYGDSYPGETFRGLKDNEIRKWGEYRTLRLVMEEFDALG